MDHSILERTTHGTVFTWEEALDVARNKSAVELFKKGRAVVTVAERRVRRVCVD